jgi:insertion element IS1 protein InsB
MEYIASDYWKPYEHIIPKEKHIQTKAETFTVEGSDLQYYRKLRSN